MHSGVQPGARWQLRDPGNRKTYQTAFSLPSSPSRLSTCQQKTAGQVVGTQAEKQPPRHDTTKHPRDEQFPISRACKHMRLGRGLLAILAFTVQKNAKGMHP